MQSEIKTEDLKLIKEIIIELALSTFNLALSLKEEGEKTISLENSIKKVLSLDLSDTYYTESNNILPIIRELDSINDILRSEQNITNQLYDQYADFVDTQTSKTITDKDKRYQIAADFFSFIAISLLQHKNDQESCIKGMETISTKLTDIERRLSISKDVNNKVKFQEIIEFASSLEKTIGKLLKGMNIDPSEILPPENQGDSPRKNNK
ncbi:hypothetical protein KKB18_08785 [bacterium]|nr:hypothetical protein [bacterium]